MLSGIEIFKFFVSDHLKAWFTRGAYTRPNSFKPIKSSNSEMRARCIKPIFLSSSTLAVWLTDPAAGLTLVLCIMCI